MISLELTKHFDYSISVILRFGIISIAGTFIAMLLARSFGGKSFIKRQAIFSVANFGSLCAAAFFAFSSLSSG